MGHDKYLALPPAREEKQPGFLTEPEYKRLMETVRFQVRDAARIEILLQTGVRRTVKTRRGTTVPCRLKRRLRGA